MPFILDVFRLNRLASYPHCGGEAAIAKTLFRPEYGAFAEQLRKMRLDAGLTQEELAARMKVSQRYVSRCESRERRVDFFELVDWCRATGVALPEFLQEMTSLFPHDILGEE